MIQIQYDANLFDSSILGSNKDDKEIDSFKLAKSIFQFVNYLIIKLKTIQFYYVNALRNTWNIHFKF